MTSKMIPIVHRIAILAMKPMTSRTNPRISTLLPPPAHHSASCAEDLADRTLIVPALKCQPRPPSAVSAPYIDAEGNRPASSRPTDPLLGNADRRLLGSPPLLGPADQPCCRGK
jgi:hypothetical protein